MNIQNSGAYISNFGVFKSRYLHYDTIFFKVSLKCMVCKVVFFYLMYRIIDGKNEGLQFKDNSTIFMEIYKIR